MKTTEDFLGGGLLFKVAHYHFPIDTKVKVLKVKKPFNFMNGMIGTVAHYDAYTVTVRFDTITAEMKEYGDTRQGMATFYPEELETL